MLPISIKNPRPRFSQSSRSIIYDSDNEREGGSGFESSEPESGDESIMSAPTPSLRLLPATRTRVQASTLRNTMTDDMRAQLVDKTKKLSIGKQPSRRVPKKSPNRPLTLKLKDEKCTSSGPDVPHLERSGTDGSDITIKAVEQPTVLLQPHQRPTYRRNSMTSTSTDGSLPYITDSEIEYSSSDDESNIMEFTPESGIRQRAGSDRGTPGGYSSGSSPGGSCGYGRGVRRSSDGPGDNHDNGDRRKCARKDDDDNGRRGSEDDDRHGASEDNGRRLACPYYRFNPKNPEHMRCKDKSFPTLARVKGHVLRAHLKPRQCERCCLFRAGDRGQISNHLRGGNCEKAEEFMPIDPEIEKKGNELSRQGCSKTWEQVCMVLFDCTREEVPPAFIDVPMPALTTSQTLSTSSPNTFGDPKFIQLLQERFTAFATEMFPKFLSQELPNIITRYQELNTQHQNFLQKNPSPTSFAGNASRFLAPTYGTGCLTRSKSPPALTSNTNPTPAASPAFLPSQSPMSKIIPPGSFLEQVPAQRFFEPFASAVPAISQPQQEQTPKNITPSATIDLFRLSSDNDQDSVSDFGMDMGMIASGGEESWDIMTDIEAGTFFGNY